MTRLMPYLKAIYAAISAAIATTGGEYVNGNGHIGWQGGIIIAGAFWGALGVVWGVPNVPSMISSAHRRAPGATEQ